MAWLQAIPDARVSTVDPRFARLAVATPRSGPATAWLVRAPRGWRALDMGPARVGCGLVPDRVLRDLGAVCPGGGPPPATLALSG